MCEKVEIPDSVLGTDNPEKYTMWQSCDLSVFFENYS